MKPVGFFALLFATGLLFVLPWPLFLVPLVGYLVLRPRRKPLESPRKPEP